jgi:DNA-binding NtrC family response regulator
LNVEKVQVVITDMKMPKLGGLDVLKIVKDKYLEEVWEHMTLYKSLLILTNVCDSQRRYLKALIETFRSIKLY